MNGAQAVVTGVKEALVRIRAAEGRVIKNEVAYIHVGDRRLQAEVLRVRGATADLQVFEDTRGIRVGMTVDLTGELLSATLGPGLLGQVYDGLQNPLDVLSAHHGNFLERGARADALDADRLWHFEPAVATGATIRAGETLGHVQEGHVRHHIFAPTDLARPMRVAMLGGGRVRVADTVAALEADGEQRREISLAKGWPIRRPFVAPMLRAGTAERIYPERPLVTTMRLIDTFFPIALGGTACIPGPFGAGKTVLQNLIARYAAADVVVIVACGERAGEVVETITELPRLPDPRTGGTLMERTVLICNTSSMPVAARESSLYLGVTIAEYYRHMGLNALVIADSTSRWAQALREISGLLEEIPGDEAFPAYLDSAVRALYERAGIVRRQDGTEGSVTMIGTVSPAGGNFDEPVTQATLATVKTFLGLSAERAYRRFYPAVDPLLSWSRTAEQLERWRREQMGPDWIAAVAAMLDLLRQGHDIEQMMHVTGEEGVSLDDFLVHLKARLVDAVFLQQNAYDPVDVSTALERQKDALLLLRDVVAPRYAMSGKAEAQALFDRFTHLLLNLNYSHAGSEEHQRRRSELMALVDEAQEGLPAPASPPG